MNSKVIGAVLLVVGLCAAVTLGLLTRETGESPVSSQDSNINFDYGRWSQADELSRREVAMMGTNVVFVVEGTGTRAEQAILAAENRLRELEARLSEWRPSSEISALNARAGIEAVKVSPDTMEILRLSKRYHADTSGAFDVTIGPLWDLWPFRNKERALPTQAELDSARKLVDASRLVLDESSGTAFLPQAGMRVNIGAIGKGYAAKLGLDVIRSHGFTRAAISAGGDVCLMGRKSSGPWVVGIEHPLYAGQFIERFETGDAGVATSGNAQRFVVREGKRYGHILDPKTGWPVDDCLSVTIVCSDAVAADAFATAVFVMGPSRGMEWVEARGDVEALIVDAQGLVHRSSGWSRVARAQPEPTGVKQAPKGHIATPPTRTTPVDDLGCLDGRDLLGDLVGVAAGEYLLGDGKKPENLPGFRIDRCEVSNAQYAAFLDAERTTRGAFDHQSQPKGKDHTPRYWREFRPTLFLESGAATLAPFDEKTFRDPQKPVVGVDWWDAFAYARWAGKRLPTALEWEAAARGRDGRLWPFGNQWSFSLANTGGEKWGEKDGHIYAAPVGDFDGGKSPSGCLNMAGNVAEWTQEGFVAGGSSNSNPTGVRCAARELREPEYRSFDIGFRCAAEAKP